MQAKSGGRMNLSSILRSFISSPAMAAIILALILNATHLFDAVSSTAVSQGFIASLEVISAATSPLILIIIGYEKAGLGESLRLIAVRMATIAVLGTAFVFLAHRFIMEIDSIMLYAFITFLILPPPFIIPIFLPKSAVEQNRFLNNAIVLHTIISLVLYAVILLFIL